jgi:cyclohexa-1,5-dienecarbonyl-CoA hydratase
MERTLDLTEADGALWIRLGRAPVNVLDADLIQQLDAALAAAAPRRELKAVVLASAFAGIFSAGVDVADHARDRAPAMLEGFHALIRRLDALPQAAIAAVDGRCLGGGCELALACDFVLATPRAQFGQPEIDVGCFPPVAAVLLPRLSWRRAAEMVLLGERLSAAEAERAGLITRVVDDLDAAVRDLVARLAAKSGAVLGLARRALRQGAHGPFPAALDAAEQLYRRELLATDDVEEGVRAFLEKRPPRWSDH